MQVSNTPLFLSRKSKVEEEQEEEEEEDNCEFRLLSDVDSNSEKVCCVVIFDALYEQRYLFSLGCVVLYKM